MEVFLAIVVVVMSIMFWLDYENTHLDITKYEIDSIRVPRDFKDFKIVQLSDFHNNRDITFLNKVIYEIRNIKPDLILITGDIVDSYSPNIEVACLFVKQLTNIAPTYYTTGNHEFVCKKRSEFFSKVYNVNENFGHNNVFVFKKNRQKINIIALEDPMKVQLRNKRKKSNVIVREAMEKIRFNHRNFTILISHRPDLYKEYDKRNIDLIFTGHAHGGQFNIPPFGPIYAPSQGMFPKYAKGMYDLKNSKMIVNRGLGNSSFPFRINNKPEIVVVTLKNSHIS